MKCPHCEKNISDKKIARYLASKGGSKPRKRTLSIDRARAMAQKSAEVRRKNLLDPRT